MSDSVRISSWLQSLAIRLLRLSTEHQFREEGNGRSCDLAIIRIVHPAMLTNRTQVTTMYLEAHCMQERASVKPSAKKNMCYSTLQNRGADTVYGSSSETSNFIRTKTYEATGLPPSSLDGANPTRIEVADAGKISTLGGGDACVQGASFGGLDKAPDSENPSCVGSICTRSIFRAVVQCRRGVQCTRVAQYRMGSTSSARVSNQIQRRARFGLLRLGAIILRQRITETHIALYIPS